MADSRRSYMTVFGAVCWELFAIRGAKNFADVQRHLAEHGHDFSRDTIRNYVTGRTCVPARFAVALSDSLSLDQAERDLLADSFAYGQAERLGHWYLERGIRSWPQYRRRGVEP